MSSNTSRITAERLQVPTLLSLASLAARDRPPLNLYLAALDTLVLWQIQPPAQHTLAAPAVDSARCVAQLQGFSLGYLQGYRHVVLDESMRKTVDNALATIGAQVLALPTVLVHGGFGPDQLTLSSHSPAGFAADAPAALALGPVGYDIACMTRDPRLLWDEAFTLDVSIRYWDKARKAGLPVGSDFGEFYRGLEWTALMHHLTVLGERAKAGDQAPEHAPELMALILATCNRYIELKPLLRLLERLEGLDVQGGFVFGRI